MKPILIDKLIGLNSQTWVQLSLWTKISMAIKAYISHTPVCINQNFFFNQYSTYPTFLC